MNCPLLVAEKAPISNITHPLEFLWHVLKIFAGKACIFWPNALRTWTKWSTYTFDRNPVNHGTPSSPESTIPTTMSVPLDIFQIPLVELFRPRNKVEWVVYSFTLESSTTDNTSMWPWNKIANKSSKRLSTKKEIPEIRTHFEAFLPLRHWARHWILLWPHSSRGFLLSDHSWE